MEETMQTTGNAIAEHFKKFIEPEFLTKTAVVVIAIFLLWIVYTVVKKIFKKIPDGKIKPQVKNIILKVLKYTFEVMVVIYVLNLFGINLNAIFGAAGIAGIAIGLAAQTSLGNIISGFFVLQEKVFKIGDHIEVNGVEGNVESIGLLAIKIRTFDNQIVRVPNEILIKSNIENYSVMDIRRVCMFITLPYDANLAGIVQKLSEAVSATPLVLKEPTSSVTCNDFTDSGAVIRIAAWMKYSDFFQCRNNLVLAVTDACKKNGVEIQCQKIEVADGDEKAKLHNLSSEVRKNV